MQQRAKSKLSYKKGTGGGSTAELNEMDKAVLDVLGDRNPSITKIPNAIDVNFCSGSATSSSSFLVSAYLICETAFPF